MINIAEIFGPTIQGEGINVGKKTLFVRTAGCDFRCSWCDSKFTWKIGKDSMKVTPKELTEIILKKCKDTYTSNVVITGGNPCLYSLGEVVDALHDNGISIDIETQGSILPDWLKRVDTLIISPKAPSSGQRDVFDKLATWFTNDDINVPNIAFKIPVFNDEDFEFAKKYYDLAMRINTLGNNQVKLYLSVGNTDTSEQNNIAERVLEDYKKLIEKTLASDMEDVYILPQVHTLVWGNKQGV